MTGPPSSPEVDTVITSLGDDDVEVRRRAFRQVMNIGPAALPSLVRSAASHSDSSTRFGASLAVLRLSQYAEHVRADLLRSLPELIELATQNDGGGAWIRQSILTLGEEAVPGLLRYLSTAKDGERLLVLQVLSDLPTVNTNAAATVAPFLCDDDVEVRCAAARALAQAGGRVRQAIEAMEEILRHGTPEERVMAARTLEAFGPRAAQTLPVLREITLARDCGLHLVAAAAEAVFVISDRSQEMEEGRTIEEWIERLRSRDSEEQEEAVQVMDRLIPASEEAVQALCRVASAGLSDRANLALRVLRKMGSIAIAYLATEASRGTEIEERERALSLLVAMGPSARVAAPDLVRVFLADRSPDIRRQARDILIGLGEGAKPFLLQAYQDNIGSTRGRIKRILEIMATDTPLSRVGDAEEEGWTGHRYSDREICMRCGASRAAINHFGWRCVHDSE